MLEDLAHQIRALAGTDDFDQVVPSWDIHAREIHTIIKDASGDP